MSEPETHHETTIIETRERGGGGTLIAVVLLIAVLALLFYLFGGELMGGGDTTDVKVDVRPRRRRPITCLMRTPTARAYPRQLIPAIELELSDERP